MHEGNLHYYVHINERFLELLVHVCSGSVLQFVVRFFLVNLFPVDTY